MTNEPGRPRTKGGTRHGQLRTRRKGRGPGHPPALRKTRNDKGKPRK